MIFFKVAMYTKKTIQGGYIGLKEGKLVCNQTEAGEKDSLVTDW